MYATYTAALVKMRNSYGIKAEFDALGVIVDDARKCSALQIRSTIIENIGDARRRRAELDTLRAKLDAAIQFFGLNTATPLDESRYATIHKLYADLDADSAKLDKRFEELDPRGLHPFASCRMPQRERATRRYEATSPVPGERATRRYEAASTVPGPWQSPVPTPEVLARSRRVEMGLDYFKVKGSNFEEGVCVRRMLPFPVTRLYLDRNWSRIGEEATFYVFVGAEGYFLRKNRPRSPVDFCDSCDEVIYLKRCTHGSIWREFFLDKGRLGYPGVAFGASIVRKESVLSIDRDKLSIIVLHAEKSTWGVQRMYEGAALSLVLPLEDLRPGYKQYDRVDVTTGLQSRFDEWEFAAAQAYVAPAHAQGCRLPNINLTTVYYHLAFSHKSKREIFGDALTLASRQGVGRVQQTHLSILLSTLQEIREHSPSFGLSSCTKCQASRNVSPTHGTPVCPHSVADLVGKLSFLCGVDGVALQSFFTVFAGKSGILTSTYFFELAERGRLELSGKLRAKVKKRRQRSKLNSVQQAEIRESDANRTWLARHPEDAEAAAANWARAVRPRSIANNISPPAPPVDMPCNASGASNARITFARPSGNVQQHGDASCAQSPRNEYTDNCVGEKVTASEDFDALGRVPDTEITEVHATLDLTTSSDGIEAFATLPSWEEVEHLLEEHTL